MESLHLPKLDFPVVYCLIKDGDIVYIGASKNGFYARINDHHKDKEFDTVVYERVHAGSLLQSEKEMIAKHKPLYNKVGVCKKILNTTQGGGKYAYVRPYNLKGGALMK